MRKFSKDSREGPVVLLRAFRSWKTQLQQQTPLRGQPAPNMSGRNMTFAHDTVDHVTVMVQEGAWNIRRMQWTL